MSFFHWQLSTRGLFLSAGPHKQIAQTLTVNEFYKPIEKDSSEKEDETGAKHLEPPHLEPDENGKYPANLHLNDNIEKALRAFNKSGEEKLPVIIDKHNTQILGHATHLDALNAYNKSLIHAHEEEHK
jgi:CIC family chloride channel protein